MSEVFSACLQKMTRLPNFFPVSLFVIALGAADTIALAGESPVESYLLTAAASASGVAPDLSFVTQQIIDRTNALRQRENRRPVEGDPQLSAAAAYFADYMARTSRYGHEADGGEPASRAKRYGYDHCIISENIAYQYNLTGFTPEELAMSLVAGWKQSPGHRKNMVDPDVSDTGVAVARGAKTGYYYAVQMFGRAKASAIAFAIANRSGTAAAYTLGDERFALPPRLTRSHERCRPPRLTLVIPGSAGAVTSVQPENGDRFVVLEESGSLTISKEKETARKMGER